MKPVSILVALWLPPGVGGCAETPAVTHVAPAVTITIASDLAPALVVFRDGIDGDWQPATMKTPTTFEATVHGPYTVTVVCEDLRLGYFTTWQRARTPDDPRDLALRCDFAAPATHAITGRMVQAGYVQIGDAGRPSSAANWDFNLRVRSGTFDLMARTPDRIALRRAIAVAGDVAVTPPLDVLEDGTALADVAFTVTNADPAETLAASVHLDNPAPISPFGVYLGPIAAAKVVPDSALTATDAQSVSMQAAAGSAHRFLRRPFRVGGNTVYTLPAPLDGIQWERAGGSLAVSWRSLPEFALFSLTVLGTSADATSYQSHYLDLSPSYVAATGIASATLDTDIAGYKPAWRVEFARPYSRDLFVQRVANGEIVTNQVTEAVNAATVNARSAPRRPPAYNPAAVEP